MWGSHPGGSTNDQEGNDEFERDAYLLKQVHLEIGVTCWNYLSNITIMIQWA